MLGGSPDDERRLIYARLQTVLQDLANEVRGLDEADEDERTDRLMVLRFYVGVMQAWLAGVDKLLSKYERE